LGSVVVVPQLSHFPKGRPASATMSPPHSLHLNGVIFGSHQLRSGLFHQFHAVVPVLDLAQKFGAQRWDTVFIAFGDRLFY